MSTIGDKAATDIPPGFGGIFGDDTGFNDATNFVVGSNSSTTRLYFDDPTVQRDVDNSTRTQFESTEVGGESSHCVVMGTTAAMKHDKVVDILPGRSGITKEPRLIAWSTSFAIDLGGGWVVPETGDLGLAVGAVAGLRRRRGRGGVKRLLLRLISTERERLRLGLEVLKESTPDL